MTSIQHRILIDQCLSPALIDSYFQPHLDIAECGAEIVHYVRKFGQLGRWKDRDFVPELARDKRWLILSGDSGKQSTRYESLRLICRNCGVTLIWVSAAIRNRGLAFYGPQLIGHWDGIIAAADGPKGAQYTVRLHEATNKLAVATTLFEVRECPHGYRVEKGACVPV